MADKVATLAPTPGPWEVGFSDGSGSGADDKEGIWIVGPGGETVVAGGRADGFKYGVVGQVPWYNARLIAAAPDLLAACERALAFLPSEASAPLYTKVEPIEAARFIRAAIAKATGSSS